MVGSGLVCETPVILQEEERVFFLPGTGSYNIYVDQPPWK